ncbi:MAG: CHAT domain-containing protein [Acidimicrobiales bacterium]
MTREHAEALATEELAEGAAARERHDLVAARAHLERARDLAMDANVPALCAEVRHALARVLTTAGELELALEELDRIPNRRGDAVAGKAEGLRGLILQRLGRTDEALAAYRRALPGLRRAGDRLTEAHVRSNRGLLHAYAGRFEAADAELGRAARLYRQLDLPFEAACALHNRGFVAARQGDVPAALRAYQDAARAMAALGVEHPAALLDYCETLLRAGLIAEAREVGARAVDQLGHSGMETDRAEARLLVAEAALADGDLAEAEELAALAGEAFLAQGRTAWEVRARYTWLRVRWAQGDRSEETMRGALALADALERSGWVAASTDTRVIAARIALERGDVARAEAELKKGARRRQRAPTSIRIQAWHAEALLRMSRGDRHGAQSALRAGLRVLAGYRASLGATELRVNAGTQADDLGRLAVRLSVDSHDAERVLVWAERSRASTVRLPPVRPPADQELAARLIELREVDAALTEAASTGQDTEIWLRRKARVEDAIRQKTWHASGDNDRDATPLSLADLRQRLSPRILVEYVEAGCDLYAVVAGDGRARLCRVGAVPEIDQEIDALRFTLSRLASGQGNERSQHAMAQALAVAAEMLDTCLLGGLGLPPERPLVVVPTGPLHVLPWAALPSCLGRPVSVAPSAAIWLEAAGRQNGATGPTVLAGGPGLSHAREELDDLVGIYPGAHRLDGHAATARSVLAALDGARMAHVAAHGTFRADNPLFSSLRLSDGPLTVYELERLAHAPQRMVLSACHGGMSVVRPGNELMGLSAALFALGTATLVASMLMVGDIETRALMVDFHRRLAAGAEPAAALAGAHAVAADSGPQAAATAASFVCFGA